MFCHIYCIGRISFIDNVQSALLNVHEARGAFDLSNHVGIVVYKHSVN